MTQRAFGSGLTAAAAAAAAPVQSVNGQTGNVTTATLNANQTSLVVPAGAGEGTSPAEGHVRVNTTLGRLRAYIAGAWRSFVRLDGDSMTGALVVQSSAAQNAITITGAATGNRPSVLATGPDTNISIVVGPKGTGAFIAQVPDSTATGGNARGTNAVDLQTTRAAASNVASGATSVVVGGLSNTASGIEGVVVGGDNCVASGFKAVILGGEYNTASGTFASVGGGVQNVMSGHFSTCPGGSSSQDDGFVGLLCFASGQITNRGDAMEFRQVLRRSTTDATPTRLTANGSAPSTTNTVNLVNRSAIAGSYEMVAKANGSTDMAVWRGSFSAVRGANAASTVLVSPPLVAGAPAESSGTGSVWRLDIAADTTNGAVGFTINGVAATTIYAVVAIRAVRTYTPT